MAFRRSKSYGRRSFKRRSRSLQQPHRPRQWSRANMHLRAEHLHNDLQSLLTVFPIASVSDIGPQDAAETRRSLSNAIRYIEVGGVVWNLFVRPLAETDVTRVAPGDRGQIDCRVLLVSDRLNADLSPVALETNWFTNTQPIVVAEEEQDEDQKFPTQIHQQHAWSINYGSFPAFPWGLDITGQPVVRQTEEARRSSSTRLRLRLDDEHCLAIHCASELASISELELSLGVSFTIIGTLFYRFVFGRG